MDEEGVLRIPSREPSKRARGSDAATWTQRSAAVVLPSPDEW